mgnify:CR=1 FL=1
MWKPAPPRGIGIAAQAAYICRPILVRSSRSQVDEKADG